MGLKGAKAEYKFSKGFVVTPDHLQIISRKINERFDEVLFRYEITTNTSFVFFTDDLTEIVDFENSAANKIK